MIFKSKVSTIYECSLERAFKTPILCDVTKVHTGFGIMPKIIHTIRNENWGKIGSNNNIFTAKSLTQKRGFSSVDRILERNGNQYWKFLVDNFQSWVLDFNIFVREWKTTQLENSKILVEISILYIQKMYYFTYLTSYLQKRSGEYI